MGCATEWKAPAADIAAFIRQVDEDPADALLGLKAGALGTRLRAPLCAR